VVSGVKRDLAFTFTSTFPCARYPMVTVALEAGGAGTYTQRAIPGREPEPGFLRFPPARCTKQEGWCDTAHVAYHEAFWTVVGGAAPVIALAVIVSLGDIEEHWVNPWLAASSLPSGDRERISRDQAALATRVRRGHIGNLVLQTVFLGIALWSLAAASNIIPPWGAVVGEVLGIALLALGAIGSSHYKVLNRMLSDLSSTPGAPTGNG
jgi:hypothetical protein